MTTVGSKRDMRNIVAYLKKRRDELVGWLNKEDPHCFARQKHLEEKTEERVYWHYGYLTAVRDTLQLLTRRDSKASRA
jgi:hypothetical protein